MVKHLLLVLVRAYLEVFVRLSGRRSYVRLEHGLLLGSIEYIYDVNLDARLSRHRALFHAIWNHLGELQPFALYAKTRADAKLQGAHQRASLLGYLSQAAIIFLAVAVAAVALILMMLVLVVWPSAKKR